MRCKKGHNKLKSAKVKFFADHANYRFKHGLTLGRFLSASRKETLLHAGIVDTQELVLGGGLEQIGTDDLVKCLAQVGRTPLGGRIALGNVLAGLVYRRINAGETYNGAAVVMISLVLLFLGRVVICPMLLMYRSAALESLK